MPVPSQGHYGFHSFPVVDWFCLFIYLWALTFPLLDCSEFGNFVITLIYCTNIPVFYKNLLGQWCVLQSCDFFVSPLHFFPPCWGAGLVQDLLLSCFPVPQVKLQVPQADQDEKPPSTEIIICKLIFLFFILPH
jgi:hypothetical protein